MALAFFNANAHHGPIHYIMIKFYISQPIGTSSFS